MTLITSSVLHVLEMFRVPYRLQPGEERGEVHRIRSDRGAEMLWIRPAAASTRGWHRIGNLRVFAAVATEKNVQRALEESGRDWHPANPVLTDETGIGVAHVWRAPDGSALLPFDPDALVSALLREEYIQAGRGVPLARNVYYRLRPIVPRRVQIATRRRFLRVQERATFPRWPTETALHDLYGYLLALLEDVHGEPLPWIAPWPAPYGWAVALTHDVERDVGYRNVDALVAIEKALGVRSAWYFVPERDYEVQDTLIQELSHEGFEIGVHGLKHDGRDVSEGAFDQRLPSMRRYAERWGAIGFRAPATQRNWERMARLGFDHDSSYSDVARFEPQPGGSCSWLPFFVGDVVELPITLPMDHTLFELRREAGVDTWLEKASFLRSQGGMALLLTHPDYLLEPWQLELYERFVSFVASSDDAWSALPRDLSSWWRRRAASSLVYEGGAWRVHGPAAGEARALVGVPAARLAPGRNIST